MRRRSRRIFEHHGLRLATELPGMLAERILPPERPLPGIDVRRVYAGSNWDGFCEVGSVCFHVPITWFREVFDSGGVWDGFMSFVGYVDGEAVSTTSLVSGAGVLGVYNVATLPGHQRRGYGEAVMRHALAEVLAPAGRFTRDSAIDPGGAEAVPAHGLPGGGARHRVFELSAPERNPIFGATVRSFIAQRGGGIDARCPPGGQVARDHGSGEQDADGRGDRQEIVRLHAKEKRFDVARGQARRAIAQQ